MYLLVFIYFLRYNSGDILNVFELVFTWFNPASPPPPQKKNFFRERKSWSANTSLST